MAILDTIKKIKPLVKTATGYIHLMLSSQSVSMDNGNTLQEEINEINNNLTTLNNKSSGTVTSVGMNAQYCGVRKSGGIGIIDINGNLKEAIGKWGSVTLFTSSILPKWSTIGVVTDQNGYTADITFNMSGAVILETRNKDVTDTWYRGQIVFVVA